MEIPIEGDIIPGKCIGPFRICSNEYEIREILECEEWEWDNLHIAKFFKQSTLNLPNDPWEDWIISLNFDKALTDNHGVCSVLYSIFIKEGFNGKFHEKFSIGSNISEFLSFINFEFEKVEDTVLWPNKGPKHWIKPNKIDGLLISTYNDDDLDTGKITYINVFWE